MRRSLSDRRAVLATNDLKALELFQLGQMLARVNITSSKTYAYDVTVATSMIPVASANVSELGLFVLLLPTHGSSTYW
jgi:hypothetical protein